MLDFWNSHVTFNINVNEKKKRRKMEYQDLENSELKQDLIQVENVGG